MGCLPAEFLDRANNILLCSNRPFLTFSLSWTSCRGNVSEFHHLDWTQIVPADYTAVSAGHVVYSMLHDSSDRVVGSR